MTLTALIVHLFETMGIHTAIGTCEDQDVAVLINGTTGWAFGPTFSSPEDVETFLALGRSEGTGDVRSLTTAELERLHVRWLALPICPECGERIVKASPEGTECEECRPECELDGCDDRGDVRLEPADLEPDARFAEVYCADHAAEVKARVKSMVDREQV